MNRDEVKAIVEREPFRPYRIHLDRGKQYDVLHRDAARFLGYAILVFIGLREGTHQAKDYDRFPFERIDRIENIAKQEGRRKKAS